MKLHASLAVPLTEEFDADALIPSSVRERASVKVSRRPSNSWSVISDYMTVEVDKGGTGDSSKAHNKVQNQKVEQGAPEEEVVMIEEGTEEDLAVVMPRQRNH